MTRLSKPGLIYSSALVLSLLFAGPVAAQSSSAMVTQIGNAAKATTDQVGADGADITVEQIGDRLRANIVQHDAAHKVDLSMDGSDNDVDVGQSGLGRNQLDIRVSGSLNSISANQFAELGGTNIARLSQMGVGNQALIQQQAAVGQNYLTLAQNGNNNVASMSQTGSENQLDLTQNGDANNAVLSQDGIGLILGIIQNGGATTIVNQTGPGGG